MKKNSIKFNDNNAMKNKLLFTLLFLLSINCYSQITFSKGYFIDNDNNRVECLIKNVDWKNNPTSFQYKITENGKQNTVTLKSGKEFEIYGESKYQKHSVDIDKSSYHISDLTRNDAPNFEEDELFLKVLIQGKASLFLYENGDIKKYFYATDQNNIKQLVYTKYLAPGGKIGENDEFRKQLWNSLKCNTLPINKIKTIRYRRNELVSLFALYNECTNSGFINYDIKKNNGLFHIALKVGVSNSSLSIEKLNLNAFKTDFNKQLIPAFGIEAELIFPFKKNKWAVFIEPTYYFFKSEKEISYFQNGSITYPAKLIADYKAIQIPIGIKHYSYLNNNSKLFIKAAFSYDIPLSSTIVVEREVYTDLRFPVNNKSTFLIGFGYENKKYSIEIKYEGEGALLFDQELWKVKHRNITLVAGFKIL